MKPAPFDYHAPRSTDEALSLLNEYGSDAKPLAGGQSLIPAMNFRLAQPAVLIDLNAIPELSFVESADGHLRIGAMTRHREVEHHQFVARDAPLLHETMPFIAHAAIRTRGTLGGSLAHADPAAELPAVMVALDAQIGLRSLDGRRQVAASEFFTGLFSTALAPGELLTDVEIPVASSQRGRTGWAFEEFSRRHGDFALAGVAVAITLNSHGLCAEARIALLGVGDWPTLATHGAQALAGNAPTASVIRAAAEAVASNDIDPTSDIHASSRYRRQLARVLTTRALERAVARIGASS